VTWIENVKKRLLHLWFVSCEVSSSHCGSAVDGRPLAALRSKGRLQQRRVYKPGHKPPGYGRPNHFVMMPPPPRRNIPLGEPLFSSAFLKGSWGNKKNSNNPKKFDRIDNYPKKRKIGIDSQKLYTTKHHISQTNHVQNWSSGKSGRSLVAHTVFDFPFFFNPSWPWTHPPTSEFFSEFWNFFISSRPLSRRQTIDKVGELFGVV